MTPTDEDASNLTQQVESLHSQLARERQRSRSRELARIALSQLDVEPERALLLANEAIAAAVTFESRDALQQAVSASKLRWLFEKPSEARILHAYFAKDSRQIITAGQDGVLRWWDRENRKEIETLKCCAGPIEKFLLSPLCDRAFVMAKKDETGKYQRILVDLIERKITTTIEHELDTCYVETTLPVFFSRDGRRLVLNTDDGTELSLWDTTNGTRLFYLVDSGRCHGIDWKGRRALVTRHDLTVVLLDMEGDGPTTLLKLPWEEATASSFTDLVAGPICFTADGTRVTSGTHDRIALLWDARDGSLLHVLGHRTPCHGSNASFTPSGRFITVQQNDSVETEVWDAETGKQLCALPFSSAFYAPVRYLTFSPQANALEYRLVGMGATHCTWPLSVNQVSEWDIRTGAIRTHFRMPGKQSFQRAFSNEGTSTLWTTVTEQDDISLDADWVLRLKDGVVRVFVRLELAEALDPAIEYGSGYTIDRTASYTGGDIKLMDRQTNQELALLGKINRPLFSPNGQYLVAQSHSDTNPLIKVWNARTGELLFTINDYTKTITAMQFQPGQPLLLIGSLDRTIRVWSLETGAEVARAMVNAPDGPSYEAASSADGTKVAFPTRGRLHVWHIDRGVIVSAPTTLYARGPRFSADGRWLIASDEDAARIWDTTRMELIGEFLLHFSNVASGDISSDKKFAATCGQDGYIRLWDPLTGREITHWKMPISNNHRWGVRFSEDGDSLHFGGERLICDVEPLIALAKKRVFRELSPDERRLFLGDY